MKNPRNLQVVSLVLIHFFSFSGILFSQNVQPNKDLLNRYTEELSAIDAMSSENIKNSTHEEKVTILCTQLLKINKISRKLGEFGIGNKFVYIFDNGRIGVGDLKSADIRKEEREKFIARKAEYELVTQLVGKAASLKSKISEKITQVMIDGKLLDKKIYFKLYSECLNL
ncbi:MAG: hypothetical protein V4733_08460 [Verrucomicrobiota bacterium]